MKVLVDSNILLRLAHTTDPQHQITIDATTKLHRNKDQLCTVPQCFYEFWVVATRPTNANGLAFTAAQVQLEVVKLKKLFAFLDETPPVFAEWERLVSAHTIIGKKAHDAHLVASMIVHRITNLLTFNKQDFQRFTSITVLTPADVIAALPDP